MSRMVRDERDDVRMEVLPRSSSLVDTLSKEVHVSLPWGVLSNNHFYCNWFTTKGRDRYNNISLNHAPQHDHDTSKCLGHPKQDVTWAKKSGLIFLRLFPRMSCPFRWCLCTPQWQWRTQQHNEGTKKRDSKFSCPFFFSHRAFSTLNFVCLGRLGWFLVAQHPQHLFFLVDARPCRTDKRGCFLFWVVFAFSMLWNGEWRRVEWWMDGWLFNRRGAQPATTCICPTKGMMPGPGDGKVDITPPRYATCRSPHFLLVPLELQQSPDTLPLYQK